MGAMMSYYMRKDITKEEIQRRLDEEDLLARLPPEESLSSVVPYLTQEQWNLEEERAKAKNQVEYDAMMGAMVDKAISKMLHEYVSPAARSFVPPNVYVPKGWSDWKSEAPLQDYVTPAARSFVPPDNIEKERKWHDLTCVEQARVVAAEQVIDDIKSGTLQWDNLTSEGRALFVDTADCAEQIADKVDRGIIGDWVLRTHPREQPPVSFDQLSDEQKACILVVSHKLDALTFETYQACAKKTAIYSKDARVFYPALGLTGEVGEFIEKVLQMSTHAGKVANQVKKIIRDDDSECNVSRMDEIAKELGGVLWYLSAIATDLGLDLGVIAQENLDILASRQKRGVIQGDGDDR